METSFLGKIKEFLWNTDLRKVMQNPIEIMNIENPSEKAQVYAVHHKVELIQHLKNPCEKAQLSAVVKDPSSIMLIENPTEKVQMYVVRKNPTMIQYIDSPTERVQLEAVKRDPISAIFNINVPSEKVQMYAVYTDASLLSAIKDPCERAQLLGVKKSPELIGTLSSPSEKVQLAAISSNADSIKLIKNPCERVQIAAVSKFAQNIGFIKNPTEKAQLAAISKNINHAALIDMPSNKVCILFANTQLENNFIPLDTKNTDIINLIKDYFKEKRELEGGSLSNNQERQMIAKLKEFIRENLNADRIEMKENVMTQYLKELEDKGNISFANKDDKAAFNQRYDFLNQKESYHNHYEQNYLGADYADDLEQKIEEKNQLDKSKDIYDKNYKIELRDTINNDGIQKIYHSVTPDGRDYIRYTSPEGNRLEIAPFQEGGYGIRCSDNLTQSEYKPITDNEFSDIKTEYLHYKERDINDTGVENRMNSLKEKYIDSFSDAGNKGLSSIEADLNPEKFLYTERAKIMEEYANNPFGNMREENVSQEGMNKWAETLKEYSKMQEASTEKVDVHPIPTEMKINAGHRDFTISDGKAAIHTNGQTFDATNIISTMKDEGVDINKIPKETMTELLKGKRVQLPGTNQQNLFGLIKGPAGFTLKIFQIAKQANAVAAQEM